MRAHGYVTEEKANQRIWKAAYLGFFLGCIAGLGFCVYVVYTYQP